jgi:hypothetical protein
MDCEFRNKLIRGTCLHSITVIKEGAETVNFDSSKWNIIGSINDKSAKYDISIDLQLGSKFQFQFQYLLRNGTVFTVLFRVHQQKLSAIDSLDPAATKGKKSIHMFFTQGQVKL